MKKLKESYNQTTRRKFLAQYGELAFTNGNFLSLEETSVNYRKLMFDFNDIQIWFNSYDCLDEILLASNHKIVSISNKYNNAFDDYRLSFDFFNKDFQLHLQDIIKTFAKKQDDKVIKFSKRSNKKK